jgi:membrane protein implicated in regulation of membrane protease activity
VIGVGIAFIVVGILFLFLIPWVGIAAGIVGLVLAVLWVAGFGRRALQREPSSDRRRV